MTDTKLSREVRIISEVERIWIMYDLDMNGTLEYDEIKSYLKEMAMPHLELSDNKLELLFKSIDKNNDKEVTKDEMMIFVNMLLEAQKGI